MDTDISQKNDVEALRLAELRHHNIDLL